MKQKYAHLIYLLNWPWFFLMYYLTENLIPPEACTVIWSPLDDIIPFNEWFVIPYVGWYFFVAGSLIYFLLYNFLFIFQFPQNHIISPQVLLKN